GPRGWDLYYWQNVKDNIHYKLAGELARRGGMYGDLPALAVIGVADSHALMLLGQAMAIERNVFFIQAAVRRVYAARINLLTLLISCFLRLLKGKAHWLFYLYFCQDPAE
ncbi:hypothetical protein PTE_00117, partial [Photorhabdus khanii NC19]